jgi:hypothetical protein
MMPDSANPVQHSVTVIESGRLRAAGSALKRQAYSRNWTGEDATQSAIDYAKARAKFGRGEIRVLNADGSIKDVIRLDGSTRNYD